MNEIEKVISQNTQAIRRMRTIHQSVAELKKLDPNTAVTYHFISKLCDDNKIYNIQVGEKKRILDFDELLKYIMN